MPAPPPTPPHDAPATATALCLGCSCLCDDLAPATTGEAAQVDMRGCERGRAWFQLPRHPAASPLARADGAAVEPSTAVARAAELLTESRYPLIYGLSRATSQAQRRALAIADRLHGAIDSAHAPRHLATILAQQAVGQVTCTLGEIAGRADLLVYWRVDPLRDYPRHLARFAERASEFLPGGRADRQVVIVDASTNSAHAAADRSLSIAAGGDLAALTLLRLLLAGGPIDPHRARQATGVELAAWQSLLAAMKSCRYGAIFFDRQLAEHAPDELAHAALLQLVQELNSHTRCVALALSEEGNARGADEGLLSGAGFPLAIDFRRGFPRFARDEYSAAQLLARREVDALLVVEGDPWTELPPALHESLRTLPTVVIDDRPTPSFQAATVAMAAAETGIETTGTVYRQDGVALPLRPLATATRPETLDWLCHLEQAIVARQRVGAAGAKSR